MGFFDLFKKRAAPTPPAYDSFDEIARRVSTNGRRWDGSRLSDPYRPPAGHCDGRGDLLPRGFGSELRRHTDGSYRGIASTEMVQGPDGIWRRRFDTRPRRRIDDSFLH
jgi:hypothetical protein